MNTSTNAKYVETATFKGLYLENQTSEAVEILHDFISNGPIKEQYMVQNKKNNIKSLHNTSA